MDQDLLKAIKQANVALDHGRNTMVVIRGNKIVYHSKERGLKPLLSLLENNPEVLIGSIIGDRVVGRAAAFLCLYAKVKAVFAMSIADEAIDILEKHGCFPAWLEATPYLVERNMPSRNKLDLALHDIEDPELAFAAIKRYFVENPPDDCETNMPSQA